MLTEQPISEPLDHEWLALWELSFGTANAPWYAPAAVAKGKPLWVSPDEYVELMGDCYEE